MRDRCKRFGALFEVGRKEMSPTRWRALCPRAIANNWTSLRIKAPRQRTTPSMRRDAARLRAYRARGELSGGSQSRRYQERDEEKKAKGQHRSKRQYVVAREVRSLSTPPPLHMTLSVSVNCTTTPKALSQARLRERRPRSATLRGLISSRGHNLSARSFAFPHNILCPLVRAKAKIDRMPHFAGAGPFGEFHLRHQLRFDPGRNSFILYLRGKG